MNSNHEDTTKQRDAVLGIRRVEVLGEIEDECRRHVLLGWTAAHDDRHGAARLHDLVYEWLDKAECGHGAGDDGEYRERMVQAASLIVAAILALDREARRARAEAEREEAQADD